MVNQFEPMFFGDFTLQLLDFFVMKLDHLSGMNVNQMVVVII